MTVWVDKRIDAYLQEIERYKERYKECREELLALRAAVNKDVWYWQDGGDNFPESLTCNVVMSANTLRSILKNKEQEN